LILLAILKRHQWQAGNVVTEDVIVADPETLSPVPADGATIGEVFMRGNVIMNGYLKVREFRR
jgi:acyl-CoA synthetase (AMP-forming)/AMP-acid ligase II